MADLCSAAENLAASIAAEHGLMHSIDYHEIFVASVNAPDAVDRLRRALDDEGIRHSEDALPMRASEDFGLFRKTAKSAMFFLGAFAWTVTQQDLADATGLSVVHVNRSLSELRARGLIETTRDKMTISDWPGLKSLSGFKTDYLELAQQGRSAPAHQPM
jgi:metal-dependent amidase/aminoacylase/carboxypeptidase family protein